MPEWVIALICVSIVIVAILITSLIKVIMKKVTEKKGDTFDCKKWEYLYGAISLLLSAAGVYCFLVFIVKMTDINDIIKTTSLYAGSVQTIYLFIVQLVRKGGKGLVSVLIKFFNFIKTSKDPVKELPKTIESEVEKDNTVITETNETEDNISKLSEEFVKIITGNK